MNAVILLFVIIIVIILRAHSTVTVILAICCYLIIGHVKVKCMNNSLLALYTDFLKYATCLIVDLLL